MPHNKRAFWWGWEKTDRNLKTINIARAYKYECMKNTPMKDSVEIPRPLSNIN